MNDEMNIKQERSLPVASRCDVVCLADLAIMLAKMDLPVYTMSALISSCVDLAHKACSDMGFFKMTHDSLADALETLRSLGLVQKSLYERGRKKMNAAMAFENLRKEGIDPSGYVPQQYNTLHNVQSVRNIGAGMTRAEVIQLVREFDVGEGEIEIATGGGLTEEGLEKLKNPNYDPKAAQAERDKHEEGQKIIKEQQKTAKLELARKRALAAEEGETAATEEPSTAEIVEEVNRKVADDDTPRQKTEEEIEVDEERIKEKDAALMDELDSSKAPDATA